MTAKIDPKFARRGLILVFIALLLDIIGIAMIAPVMPKFLITLTGADIGQAGFDGGLLLAVYAGMQFLFAPFIGNLSDRFGRRPILLISILTFALDNLICALAVSYTMLFVGRILAGISGASFATCTAYIADLSDDKSRTRNFGLIGMAFGAGFVFGPLFGGMLGELSPRAPFYAAALLSLLNFIFAWFFLPETLGKRQRRRFEILRANPLGSLMALRKYPAVLWVIVAFFFYWLAHAVWPSAWAFIALHRYGWSEWEIGFVFAFYGLGEIFTMGLVLPWLAKRWPDRRISLFGIVISCIAFIGYGMAFQGWMVYAVFSVTFLEYLAHAPLRALATAQVPSSGQGELQGALTSITSLTTVLGPVVYSWLFQLGIQPQMPFFFAGLPLMVSAIFVGIAGFIVLYLVKVKTKDKSSPQALLQE